MKRPIVIIAAVVLMASALPTFAQSRAFEVSGYVNRVDPNGNGVFDGPQSIDNVDVNFDAATGYGIALNIFWGDRISTEFAGSSVEPDVAFRANNPALPVLTRGQLRMIPITAVLQYHFIPNGTVDPYVGAGAAYVLFDNVKNFGDLNDVRFSSVDFKDDAGFVVNAGASVRLTQRLALYLDGKYVPVKSNAKATVITGPQSEAKIDVNPLMFAGGLTLRF
ncbi:MAG: OmpW family outer membrane protein [Acidobacteriota bacterium]